MRPFSPREIDSGATGASGSASAADEMDAERGGPCVASAAAPPARTRMTAANGNVRLDLNDVRMAMASGPYRLIKAH